MNHEANESSRGVSAKRTSSWTWFPWVRRVNNELQEHISAREVAEQALRASEAAYRSLVESLPLNIFRKDLDGRIVNANQRFCETIGRCVNEVLGCTDLELFPSELAQKYRSDDEAVAAAGHVFEAIEQHIRADGEKIYVQVLKAPVRDELGKIIGVQGMFWDVTERVVAEQERRQSDARFRQLVESNIIGVMVAGLDGRVLDANDAFLRIVGYDRDELRSGELRWDSLTPPEYRDLDIAALEHLARDRTAPPWEKEYVRRDGHRIPVVIGVSMLEGSEDQCICFVLDISHHKNIERQLKSAKEAADAASRAKSQFLANMSHEIRTPMNGIVGIAELLGYTPLNAEQREYTELILESAESLLGVINDILDFSKVEAGKLELERIAFPIRDSVIDALRSLSIRISDKDVELLCDISPTVPEYVVGDMHRLRQIIVNLVGNAIKFTSQGEVSLQLEVESADETIVRIRFHVHDTGIGIPEDKLGMIFEAFEQADNSSTRQHGGTGLGLAIVSRLVDLMGGDVCVSSKVGKGSTFSFCIPFEPSDRVVREIEFPKDARDLRILIVDDNETNRRIVRDMLLRHQFRCDAAENAAVALVRLRDAVLAGDPFRLVISDVNMPSRDGFHFADDIRRDASISEIPIILLTSGDRPEDLERCEELGVLSHLLKPVKSSELLRSVADALEISLRDTSENVERPTADALPPIRPLRILLAEDSLVNQRLTVGLLKRSQHRVDIVSNGLAAITQVQNGGYDLVLMDVQMPELDGLEATRRIREWERDRGTHIPIVAMTAHAMKGDRERCLNSGMDAYIAKPIRERDLISTIADLMHMDSGIEPVVEAQSPSADIDWSAALRTVDGDHELLGQVVLAFLAEIPKLQTNLAQAIAEQNTGDAIRAAHTSRGAMRHFGLLDLCEVTLRVEEAVRTVEWATAKQLADEIQCQLVPIIAAMEQKFGQ